MQPIDRDPFDDDFQNLVEQARRDQLAQAEQLKAADLVRLARAQTLAEHVVRRFTALASAYADQGQAVEYVLTGHSDDDDLPVVHALHWRATRPFRKLEAMISLQTGRCWLNLLADGEPVQVLSSMQGRDASEVTVDDVDQLIRLLADDRAWQRDACGAAHGGSQR